MSKLNSRTKKILIIGLSVLLSLIVATTFFNILLGQAQKNLEKGNLNAAISQYELLAGIRSTQTIEENLAIGRYEKDAIGKVNAFYDEMQRVKQEVEFASDNYQIMELTKSASGPFLDFDHLQTDLDSDLALYVKTVQNEPDYKLFKSDYLTGNAVATGSGGNYIDELLGAMTKDSVREIVDGICQMERPAKCFSQKYLQGTINDRTNMRVLNSKNKVFLASAFLIIILILTTGIYLLRQQFLRDQVEKENQAYRKLKSHIGGISSGFKNDIIGYAEALDRLEIMGRNEQIKSEVDKVSHEIRQLHLSKTAYKKGLDYKAAQKYHEAGREFAKVLPVDINYTKAQMEIEKISPEKSAPKMPRAQVEVIKARQYIHKTKTNFIAVTVRNNTSNKRVKNYEFGFAGFNEQGDQVKIGPIKGKFIDRGRAENINIKPNEVSDSSGGWSLDNLDVKTLTACIAKVEYHDLDEIWINPYYDSWYEKYENGSTKLD